MSHPPKLDPDLPVPHRFTYLLRVPDKKGITCGPECGDTCKVRISLHVLPGEGVPGDTQVVVKCLSLAQDDEPMGMQELARFDMTLPYSGCCGIRNDDGERCNAPAEYVRVYMDPQQNPPIISGDVCEAHLHGLEIPEGVAIFVPNASDPEILGYIPPEQLEAYTDIAHDINLRGIEEETEYREALAKMSREQLENMLVLQWRMDLRQQKH